MPEKDLLKGKRILVADDELDVLDSLEELLTAYEVVKASSFEEAKEFLESQCFDIAILDIMGVDGYELLEIAKERNVIAVMLTAHAMTLEDTVRSCKKGAASYVPKEEMADIITFLNDVLEAKERGISFWWRWLERFASCYERRFGPDWQNHDKDFWKNFPYYV
jgi:DNA-binding NtrC family response regulator